MEILRIDSVLPKMSARSGLAGKKPSRPHLGPSQAIFCVGRKNPKNAKMLVIFLGGPMGPIHLVGREVGVRMNKEEEPDSAKGKSERGRSH